MAAELTAQGAFEATIKREEVEMAEVVAAAMEMIVKEIAFWRKLDQTLSTVPEILLVLIMDLAEEPPLVWTEAAYT